MAGQMRMTNISTCWLILNMPRIFSFIGTGNTFSEKEIFSVLEKLNILNIAYPKSPDTKKADALTITT
jgi:hypothetical protein